MKKSLVFIFFLLLSGCGRGVNEWSKTPLDNPMRIKQPVKSIDEAKEATFKIKYKNSSVEGSGYFIHPSGYALTNNHVIDNNGMQIQFDKGKSVLDAKLISSDQCNDLALIKVTPKEGVEFPYFNIQADSPQLGDPIKMFGYPSGTKDLTLTKGIISKEEDSQVQDLTGIDKIFEADTFLEQGSSGGPILDDEFKLVGMSVAIVNVRQKVISNDVIKSQLPELFKHKFNNGWGFFGDNSRHGLLVRNVIKDSPADKVGLRKHDIVLRVADKQLDENSPLDTFCNVINSYYPNQPIELEINRGGIIYTGTVHRTTLARIGRSFKQREAPKFYIPIVPRR